MTIKNFTFFSPNGTEFPVGSNNDAKLYMMLTGMNYGTIRRKDWSSPVNTALNVQYTDTSIIAGGRYFELSNETVALKPNSVNYIHANIDLTQTTHPVSLSAETADDSNNVDLNNNSGVLKVVIDIRTTNAMGVIKSEIPKLVTTLDEIHANFVKINGLGLYPNYSKNQWTIEQVQENLFRITCFVTSTENITSNIGQLKMGPYIGKPTLPSEFNEINSSVSIADSNKSVWIMRDGPGIRFISPNNQTGVNVTAKFEFIATKK
ncbi:hypothetical protein AWRIB429_2129 [Oenococcus oeni AWRIB429]|uniref:Receptor-binding protein N-terminal shoulder domain-containing protein n=1 Tax=Oenococcus oeni AWRIB429 TaxID=655225 RepID=D3LCP9_OENOE|nr:hypothetical protein [Oenococcus oeni]EFD87341.1 hypothetical protein AWRIB429_2129 [Oenococcus oeni AWRIB429]